MRLLTLMGVTPIEGIVYMPPPLAHLEIKSLVWYDMTYQVKLWQLYT
jgi:hypothetical protein